MKNNGKRCWSNRLIGPPNFAESPFLDLSLRHQTTVTDKSLNALGNEVIPLVSLRQIVAHSVCNPTNHHCNLSPTAFGGRKHQENSLINRVVIHKRFSQLESSAGTCVKNNSVKDRGCHSRRRSKALCSRCRRPLLASLPWPC